MVKMLNKIFFIALLICISVFSTNENIVRAENPSSAAAATNFTFTQNLYLGINGDDVSALQKFLIADGFLKISTPTGYFGSLTKNALSAWQTSLNIFPSAGFFGPISRGKINAAVVQQTPIFTLQSQNATGTAIVSTSTTTASIATTSIVIASSEDGSPVRLIIPKLNIDAGFQYNGLKPDGTMEIPNNITDVGWFTGSPRPGEKGNAIVTGHVAQIRGGVLTKPGVFSNFGDLQAGDKLYVQNNKGESIAFVVRESRSYNPTADATDVFTSADGGVHLNLITCEGTWNSSQLSYSQRLVVFTDAAQ